jgi:hypothetical protein
MAQGLGQELGDLVGRGETVRGVLGMQCRNNIDEPGRDTRIQRANRRRRIIAHALQYGHGARRAKWSPPGREGIKDATEAEQVRPMVQGRTIGLLGRHIQRCARDDAALGQADVVQGPGQAEIGELDATARAFEEDVGGLDVAMDQPLRMGRGQPRRSLHPDADNFLYGQRAVVLQMVLQRQAGHVLHDQVWHAVDLIDRVHGNHVVVMYGRGRPGLTLETGAGRGMTGPRRRQHLDRDDAAQPHVHRLEHNSHAAAANHFEHLVRSEAPQVERIARRAQERHVCARHGVQADGFSTDFRVRLEVVHRAPQRRRPGLLVQAARGIRPGVIAGRQVFEGLLASAAAFQVSAGPKWITVGAASFEQVIPPGLIRAVRCTHRCLLRRTDQSARRYAICSLSRVTTRRLAR